MTRLAELLLCRADIHIDVLDDNGDTTTILAAKMNDASVAIMMLGAGRGRRTWVNVSREGRRADDEEHSATSVTGHAEHHRRRRQQSAMVQCHPPSLLRYVLPVAELCRLDVPVFGEGGRRPLHCVYDSHRCQGADVPHVIAAGPADARR